MKTLTKENARDGMTLEFFQNSGRHTLRKKPDGSWAAIPHGDANIMPLPESDFDLFMIVEEPPLVATGPDSTDKLGIVDLGASSVDLKALSGMIDDAIARAGGVQSYCVPNSDAWRLAGELRNHLHKTQALLGDKASSRMTKGDTNG